MERYHYIDIAANLTDGMFSGMYNGTSRHAPDLNVVVRRALDCGVIRTVICSGSLTDSIESLKLIDKQRSKMDFIPGSMLYSTVGVHPTRASELFTDNGDSKEIIDRLTKLIEVGIKDERVIAIGECGLDYDRTQFCDIETQKKGFGLQLEMAKLFELPLLLHNRNTNGDFTRMISDYRQNFSTGVVHSFTGDLSEMKSLIDLDLYIGINGCSLKTNENVEVVKSIPLDRIVIETDCPYCEIRPSHVGYSYIQNSRLESRDKKKYDSEYLVKGRTEPCHIRQVAEVLSGVRNESLRLVTSTVFNNAAKLFFPNEAQAMGSNPFETSTNAI